MCKTLISIVFGTLNKLEILTVFGTLSQGFYTSRQVFSNSGTGFVITKMEI